MTDSSYTPRRDDERPGNDNDVNTPETPLNSSLSTELAPEAVGDTVIPLEVVSERASRLASDSPRVSTSETPSARYPTDAGDEDVVREYERRYERDYTPRSRVQGDDFAREQGRAWRNIPRFWEYRDETPRSYNAVGVTDDERLWATVAHASVWFTVLMGILTAGILPFVSIFIPLAIYLMFRKRSEYVAFHALQAFVLQAITSVGAVLLLIGGVFVFILMLFITGLLSLLIVGIPFFILTILLGIVFFLFVAALPIIALVIGTIGVFETYNGRDYRYPYIARWVDRQLAGSYLHTV